MKRIWVAGLLAMLTLSALACGSSASANENSTSMSQSNSASQSQTESGTSDTKSESKLSGASSESTAESSVQAESTSEISSSSKEEKKQEVTLSNSQELTEDYTSMSGINVEKGAYIAVVAKGLDSSYWDMVEKGAKAAIKELNTTLGYTGKDKIRMTFEGPGDNSDVDTQINTIDAVLADNPTVLCISAIDMQSCNAQLETAHENGIPVVVIDSGVQNDLVASACATNNYAAGQLAAKKLCEAVQDSGEVAVMAHQQTSQSSMDRVSGFMDEITKNHPNVTIVETSYENKDSSVEEMIESILEKHENLAGYFCTNETVSVKTMQALDSAKNTRVKVVGFDAGTDQIKAVTEGSEYGIVCQNPYGIGYASMVSAVRLAAKLPVDTYISSGFQWIDQSNVDLEENQVYLYE